MNIKVVLILILLLIFLGLVMFVFSPEAFPAGLADSRIQELKVPNEKVILHAKIMGNYKAKNVMIAVNGGPGLSSTYMSSLSQLASEQLAVIIYDQRGTGQSTQSVSSYKLLDHIGDLEAVRSASGAEKIHILGHSWGGIVAMRYASIYPQRVRSIILIGSGPPSEEAVQPGQARLGQRIAGLQEKGIISQNFQLENDNVIKAILPAYFSNPEFIIPEEIEETTFSRTAYEHTLSAMGNWNFTDEVASLTHPILIMWGENDPFGLPMAEATRKALSNAKIEFVLLKGCGHYWQECPVEFFSHVKSFLHNLSGQ